MSEMDDFASFMEAGGPQVLQRLSRGQKVSGKVTHLSADSVFVDLGTRADGRIPRVELTGRDGELRVALGDTVTATVVDPGSGEGPLLAVALGRDQSIDREGLELALSSGTPVHARFTRAVKGGLEAEIAGARAFCPASQVDLSYVADLTPFVGQDVEVAVLELKDEGRSVVVSRRKVLEAERAAQAQAATERLRVGADVEGTVTSLKPYGAFVDLNGVEGLIHISELSASRVERPEDVVTPGETVHVRVLGIEEDGENRRIRLSLKALSQAAPEKRAQVGEILIGRVLRFLPHGVILSTEKGEGFVHKRELGLPHGSDHRRALSVDQELEVALVDGTPGKMRFSASRVDDVLAQQDFSAYRKQSQQTGALGSMSDQLQKLNLTNLPKGPSQPPRSEPVGEPPAQTKSPAQPPAAASPASGAEPAIGAGTGAPGSEKRPTPSDGSRRRRIVSSS